MNKPSGIILTNKKEIILTVFFCFLLSAVTMAQDKDRISQEVSRGNDNAVLHDSPEGSFDPRNESKPTVNKPAREVRSSISNSGAKKENPLENQGNDKELKKEGMSTLSFNLFLYIVDKFRED